jgi:hypothetical protein
MGRRRLIYWTARGRCAVNRSLLILALAVGFGGLVVSSRSNAQGRDVRAFCTVNRNNAGPGESVRPEDLPNLPGHTWRCQNGLVLICYMGASGRACLRTGPVDARRMREFVRFCRERPGWIIPGALISGLASSWNCRGTRPVMESSVPVDRQGYMLEAWRPWSPPSSARPAARQTGSQVRVPNACPFEGCRLGRWRATQSVQVYAAIGGQPRTTIRRGQYVTALEAEVRAIPRRATVTRVWDSDRARGLRVGSVVDVLHPGGEGTVVILHQGNIIQGSLDLMLQYEQPLESAPLQWTWWVRVRMPDQTSGWVRNPQRRFSGMDEFGGD